MSKVLLQPYPGDKQAFVIKEGEERLAEMVMDVRGDLMTVYHTEVFPAAEGQGLGKELLAEMADYARANHLKVRPLCSFVHAQFRRHPEQFEDIWQPGSR